MKRISTLLLSCFFLFVGLSSVSAQVNLRIADVTICETATTTTVPVIIQDSFLIGSAQMSIYWDGTGLSLNDVQSGKGTPIITENVIGDTVNLSLLYLSGTQLLPGDTMISLVLDITGMPTNVYPVKFYDGGNDQFPAPPLLFTPSFIPQIAGTTNGSVSVFSNTPTFIDCPMDTTISASTNDCGAPYTWVPPTVFDCDSNSNPIMNNGFMPGDTFPLGTTTVTYTVDDTDGNVGTPCSFTITVVDNVPPTINCPSDTTINIIQGTSPTSLPGSRLTPTASDLCGLSADFLISFSGATSLPQQVLVEANSYSFNTGVTTVTLVASDTSGNVDSCSFMVEVVEVAMLPIRIDITNAQVSCGDTLARVYGIINQNINTKGMQFSIEWDGSGLDFVQFEDLTGTVPPTIQVFDDTLNYSLVIVDSLILMAGDTIFFIEYNVSQGQPGVPYCVKDYAGGNPNFPAGLIFNTQFIPQLLDIGTGCVTIVPNQPPVITCPPDTLIDCSASTDPASTGMATATDDCGLDTILFEDSPFMITGNPSSFMRTWIAIDTDGLADTCVQTIMIQDTVPPTLNCTDLTVALDGSGMATIDSLDLGGISDNCGLDTILSPVPLMYDCADVGMQTVTIVAVDAYGNTDSCQVNITVSDTTPPVAVCQDITLQLNGNAASISAQDIDNGSSDNCDSLVLSVAPSTFDCSNLGANNVILTVTDEAGNMNTCQATVTVQDTTPPVAICQDITISLTGGNASITADQVDGGTTDNCDSVALSVAPNAFDCNSPDINLVILTATDASGNVSTCEASVTILASEPPVITCPPDTVIDCTTLLLPSITGEATATDDCGVDTIFFDDEVFMRTGNPSPLRRTWIAIDTDGQADTCVQTLFIQDTILPVLNCSDITVAIDGSGNAIVDSLDLGGIGDNCGIDSIISPVPLMYTCADIGMQTATIIAVDNFGNVDSCQVNITVADTTPPVAVCQDLTLTLNGNSASITAADIDNGSTDNCDSVALSVAPSTFACDQIGANAVVLTATDAFGNVSTCEATVTVQDTTAPVAICQDISIALNGTTASITAEDVDGGSTDNCDSIALSILPVTYDCDDLGPNTVVLTVTDASGNVSTCEATVTVQDTMPPTVLCRDITISLDANNMASITPINVLDPVNSTDNCLAVNVDSVIQNTFDCSNVGDNTVILYASDNGGNVGTCEATVTVQDTTAPTAVCQDITLALDGDSTSITAADIDNGSTDNCDSLVLSVTPSTFDCSNQGTNNVVLMVTDASGNSDSCTAIVTVQDTSAPTAVCQDITLALDGDSASITAADIDNGSSDNCDSLVLSVTPSTFDCSNQGANNVILTVTDEAGNSASCSAIVTVQDTTAPTAVCQDITLALDGDSASITAADIDNGSSDNCDSLVLSVTPSTFDCSNQGANNVILMVTDEAGNSASCSAIVTVQDTTAPTAVCQDITLALDGDSASITAADIDNGSTDNCDSLVLSVTPSTFDCSNQGANSVVLMVTDEAGNSDSCTAIVTVLDTTPPTLVCNNDTLYLNTTGMVNTDPFDVLDTANSTDNCLNVTFDSISPTVFTCADLGDNTVTIFASDDAGNSSSCTATVTVLDTIPPTAVCEDITVQLNQNGFVTIEPADVWDEVSSSDNCDSLMAVSVVMDSFVCANAGPNTVTLTIVDGSGNTATCEATVTVEGGDPLSVVCQDDSVYLDAAGMAIVTAMDVINADSSESCGGIVVVSITPDTFSCADLGVQAVTVIVTDVQGALDTCTAEVTVFDTLPPMAICQSATISLDSNGMATVTAAEINNGSSDNCDSLTFVLSQTDFTCDDLGANVVTLTVTDGSGNVSTCSDTVTVIDQIGPQIICPPDTIINSLGPIAVFGIAPVLVTDNCPSQLDTTFTIDTLGGGAPTAFGIGDASGQVFNIGSYVVTYFVADEAGNADTCSFVVTINDIIPPEITCPADTQIVLRDQNCDVVVNDIAPDVFAIAIDSLVYTLEGATMGGGMNDASGDTFNIGTTLVTYIVADTFGLADTCTFIVEVIDSAAPVITCPDTLTISVESGFCQAIVTDFAAQVDECSPFVVVWQSSGATAKIGFDAVNDTFDLGITEVTFFASDIFGNEDSCTAVIKVVDLIPPAIVCPSDTVVNVQPGACAATVNGIGLVSAIDACGGIGSIDYSLSGATFGSDTLDASGVSFNVGVTTVTYVVSDTSGNFTNCSFTVTVVDNEDPTINCPTAQINLSLPPDSTSVPFSFSPQNSDNCEVVDTSWTLLGATGGSGSGALDTFLNKGTTVITFVVTDASGNTAICTFNVFVDDAPEVEFVCPNNVDSVNAPMLCGDSIFGIDLEILSDIGQVDSVGYTLSGATMGSDSGSVSGIFFNVGTTVVTYSVTDTFGVTAFCSFFVTVTDTEQPEVICPDSVIVYVAAEECFGVANWAEPVINDNCPARIISSTAVPGDTFSVGTTRVTYVVGDNSNNFDQCSFDVTVIDTITPTIICPPTDTIFLPVGTCERRVLGLDPIISDNCPNTSLSYRFTKNNITVGTGNGSASGQVFGLGTTTVTYTVVDASGNEASCSFDLFLQDTFPPVIICPDSRIIEIPDTASFAIVTSIDPVSTFDNCGIVNVSYFLEGATVDSGTITASGDSFNVGETTVIYIGTDASGNTDTCRFIIVVEQFPLEGPEIRCPADVIAYATADSCGAFVFDIPVEVLTDTSIIADTTFSYDGITGDSDASGSFFELGETIVTYSVSDTFGNVTNCSFRVLVLDTLAPSIICPPDIIAFSDADSCGTNVFWSDPVVDDNCTITSVNCNFDSGDFFSVTETTPVTVTCVASDQSGNLSSCSFTVTVLDTIPPSIICPTNVVTVDVTGECGAIVNDLDPVIADNCSGDVDLNYTRTGATMGSGLGSADGFYNVGLTNVTYRVEDEDGNIDSCTFTVIVQDTISAMVECGNDTTINAMPGDAFAIITGLNFSTSDNCAVTDTIYVLSGATSGMGSGQVQDTFNIGETVVTIIVGDGRNAPDTCEIIVTVINDNPIKLECPTNIVAVADSGICSTVVNDLSLMLGTPADSVLIDSVWFVASGATSFNGTDDVSGRRFNVGLTSVTYFVRNIFGTISSCTFNVIVQDLQPPVIECPEDIILFADEECQGFLDTLQAISLFDNCGIDSLFYTSTGVTQLSGQGALTNGNFNLGLTIVTLTAIDESGFEDACQVEILVRDTTPPTISCIGDTVLYVSADNQAGCVVDLCDAVLDRTDNCGLGGVSYTLFGATQGTGTGTGCLTLNLGTTTVTYTTSDNSGNNSVPCSFEVTVLDTIVPFIDCSAFDGGEANAIFGECESEVVLRLPELSDNCDDSVSVTYTYLDADSMLVRGNVPDTLRFPVGDSITFMYTATDASGNSSTCDFTLKFVDDRAPVIDCPDSFGVTVDAVPGDCFANVVLTDIINPDSQIIEGCLLDSLYYFRDGIDTMASNWIGDTLRLAAGDTTEITLIAVDEFGNADTCVFELRIRDIPLSILFDNDDEYCEGTDVVMSTNAADNAQAYIWTNEAGDTLSTSPNLRLPDVRMDQAGEYCVQIFYDGGECVKVACDTLRIIEGPLVRFSGDSMLCVTEPVMPTLTGIQLDSTQDINWIWRNINGDTISTEQIVNLPYSTMDTSATYSVVASTDSSSCIASGIVHVFVTPQPPGSVSASSLCGEIVCLDFGLAVCDLSGSYSDSLPVQEYRWRAIPSDSTNGLPAFTDTTDITIMPSAAGVFEYEFTAVVNGCEIEPATVDLTVLDVPTAERDTYFVQYDGLLSGDVTLNDLLIGNAGYTVELIGAGIDTAFGQLSIRPDGTFDFVPSQFSEAPLDFRYRLCYDECPDFCAETFVVIIMTFSETECLVSPILSPNDDGDNDFLRISCLFEGDFDQNELLIFNIWGDEVFSASPYINGTWGGTNQDGQPLPGGTYFFIFIPEPGVEAITGTITIFEDN